MRKIAGSLYDFIGDRWYYFSLSCRLVNDEQPENAHILPNVQVRFQHSRTFRTDCTVVRGLSLVSSATHLMIRFHFLPNSSNLSRYFFLLGNILFTSFYFSEYYFYECLKHPHFLLAKLKLFFMLVIKVLYGEYYSIFKDFQKLQGCLYYRMPFVSLQNLGIEVSATQYTVQW